MWSKVIYAKLIIIAAWSYCYSWSYLQLSDYYEEVYQLSSLWKIQWLIRYFTLMVLLTIDVILHNLRWRSIELLLLLLMLHWDLREGWCGIKLLLLVLNAWLDKWLLNLSLELLLKLLILQELLLVELGHILSLLLKFFYAL